jgi:hypothetical protein
MSSVVGPPSSRRGARLVSVFAEFLARFRLRTDTLTLLEARGQQCIAMTPVQHMSMSDMSCSDRDCIICRDVANLQRNRGPDWTYRQVIDTWNRIDPASMGGMPACRCAQSPLCMRSSTSPGRRWTARSIAHDSTKIVVEGHCESNTRPASVPS